VWRCEEWTEGRNDLDVVVLILGIPLHDYVRLKISWRMWRSDVYILMNEISVRRYLPPVVFTYRRLFSFSFFMKISGRDTTPAMAQPLKRYSLFSERSRCWQPSGASAHSSCRAAKWKDKMQRGLQGCWRSAQRSREACKSAGLDRVPRAGLDWVTRAVVPRSEPQSDPECEWALHDWWRTRRFVRLILEV
jgi:hypothetical protein